MKPLRIRLKGFMSYREEQVVSFDEASLWVLSGPNGSGKSAIFDAMTFALYGVFRGSDDRRSGRALINHNCTEMLVEFDFAVGDKHYRVVRTAAHSKRPTFSAMYLNPLPERYVPGVENEKRLNEWVIETIGLNEKAFVTSVLLRQGQADVLLTAKDEEKRSLPYRF